MTQSKKTLDAIKSVGRAVAPSEVADLIGISAPKVRVVMRRLEQRGAIRRVERGRYLPEHVPAAARPSTRLHFEQKITQVIEARGGQATMAEIVRGVMGGRPSDYLYNVSLIARMLRSSGRFKNVRHGVWAFGGVMETP